jgi:hypothetical protein
MGRPIRNGPSLAGHLFSFRIDFAVTCSSYSYRFIFCLFSLRGVQALSDFPGPLATSNGRHKSLNEKEGKNKILEEMNKKGETRVRKKI